jgi:cytochrome c-type biogenesis protein CcmH/NrfG
MLAGHGRAALADARTAVASNPVSVDALSELSAVYVGLGDLPAARAELVKATTVQPDNPATWVALAQFDLARGEPALAPRSLERARRLNPRSPEIQALISAARERAAGA